jgi:two-component system chemotaxis sensor kinase CheA
MDELTREFLIESQEGLDRMERCLTDLEQQPGDSALLAEIFRSVHTIKGTTGFLGYSRLEKLAHAGENLLGVLRDGKLAPTQEIITGLLQLLDGLRLILKTIEADDQEGEGSDAELIGKLEMLQAGEAVAPPASDLFETATVPAKPSRRKTTRKTTVTRVKSKGTSTMQAEPEAAPRASSPDGAGVSEKHGESGLHEPRNANSAPAPIQSVSASESTLRVDIGLLNRMMNLVGELVLTRNQVLQASASHPALTMLSRRLDMVTADLRESVMKARMQPVSNVFSKMPRLVRDLSQSLHRRVRLEMEGQETELDKSLLEAIKDPLTHAVRNALDHGIETPEIREASGKSAEGTLKLRAFQEGSHVIIEISDDGAGIPVEKIREKAIARGLISADRAAQESDRELLQLIFLPGFSTAAVVTNISGRGVGMDVVRTNVEKIGGKVEIESRIGKGTTLRLRIPLTLAIIPALIVRSVGQDFALPQGALSELVHIEKEKASNSIEWIENAPLYRLRGKLLPLVFLDRLLMPGAEQPRLADQDMFITVLDADGRRFGLVVDGLADPEEIVVKPLSASLKGIGLYSGATVLGSGRLALILDPGTIAMNAGIATYVEEQSAADSADGNAETLRSLDYLLVDVGGRRAAVSLANVLRIEQFPASRVEFIGSRPVLNLESQLVPIEDSSGILSPNAHPEALIIVVVCRDGNRQIGIVVSHVLDVASGDEIFESGADTPTASVRLIRDRVTGLFDPARVPALANEQAAPVELIPFVEAMA